MLGQSDIGASAQGQLAKAHLTPKPRPETRLR